jgi:hypothetical protein
MGFIITFWYMPTRYFDYILATLDC